MSRNLKLTLSSVLVAGLLLAGCGTDKQGSVSGSLETFTAPAAPSAVKLSKTWKVKRDPKCQLDYGGGLTVADGKAELVCAGDTTLNSGPDVAAGTVNMVGPFECQTNEWGDSMRCENVTTGNGFELSADKYSTF